MSDDGFMDELNDAHGRGIIAELFRDSPDRTMRYRRLTRRMYRDQFENGMRYAHVIVPSGELKKGWEDHEL